MKKPDVSEPTWFLPQGKLGLRSSGVFKALAGQLMTPLSLSHFTVEHSACVYNGGRVLRERLIFWAVGLFAVYATTRVNNFSSSYSCFQVWSWHSHVCWRFSPSVGHRKEATGIINTPWGLHVSTQHSDGAQGTCALSCAVWR